MEVISGKSSQTNSRSVSTNRATEDADDEILYGVDECPPWYLCAFLSFQVGGFNKIQISYYGYLA